MDYAESFAQLTHDEPALAAELEGIVGLEGVLRWLVQRGLPLGKVEITAQDEFSLDFVVPLENARFLVFGIT